VRDSEYFLVGVSAFRRAEKNLWKENAETKKYEVLEVPFKSIEGKIIVIYIS